MEENLIELESNETMELLEETSSGSPESSEYYDEILVKLDNLEEWLSSQDAKIEGVHTEIGTINNAIEISNLYLEFISGSLLFFCIVVLFLGAYKVLGWFF